jgi:hypothetical protein
MRLWIVSQLLMDNTAVIPENKAFQNQHCENPQTLRGYPVFSFLFSFASE